MVCFSETDVPDLLSSKFITLVGICPGQFPQPDSGGGGEDDIENDVKQCADCSKIHSLSSRDLTAEKFGHITKSGRDIMGQQVFFKPVGPVAVGNARHVHPVITVLTEKVLNRNDGIACR